VETATVQAASWFGSRGRLPLPMAIASPSCHRRDAKASLWKLKLAHYLIRALIYLSDNTC
jgi:hypothetical protein